MLPVNTKIPPQIRDRMKLVSLEFSACFRRMSTMAPSGREIRPYRAKYLRSGRSKAQPLRDIIVERNHDNQCEDGHSGLSRDHQRDGRSDCETDEDNHLAMTHR